MTLSTDELLQRRADLITKTESLKRLANVVYQDSDFAIKIRSKLNIVTSEISLIDTELNSRKATDLINRFPV